MRIQSVTPELNVSLAHASFRRQGWSLLFQRLTLTPKEQEKLQYVVEQ